MKFLSLPQQRPREKIFVHCWLGGDRTGVFFAVYRIAIDHWTAPQALEEMRDFPFQVLLASLDEEVRGEFPGTFR